MRQRIIETTKRNGRRGHTKSKWVNGRMRHHHHQVALQQHYMQALKLNETNNKEFKSNKELVLHGSSNINNIAYYTLKCDHFLREQNKN